MSWADKRRVFTCGCLGVFTAPVEHIGFTCGKCRGAYEDLTQQFNCTHCMKMMSEHINGHCLFAPTTFEPWLWASIQHRQ